ncbi:MAG: Fe-S cluster assembly protein SufB, partial [Chloroflexi bacterium]|nr:Fe-S cluster assembly protein SufB [Chloroflexota bacterium]
MATVTSPFDIDLTKYSFKDPENYTFKSRKGLDRGVVEEISHMKKEPEWMLKRRLKALDIFWKKPMPTWGGDLSQLKFEDIFFYLRPDERKSQSWE